jgi:ABC-type cobalamin/Fe3+-siderophores transport system ATPase subunit
MMMERNIRLYNKVKKILPKIHHYLCKNHAVCILQERDLTDEIGLVIVIQYLKEYAKMNAGDIIKMMRTKYTKWFGKHQKLEYEWIINRD